MIPALRASEGSASRLRTLSPLVHTVGEPHWAGRAVPLDSIASRRAVGGRVHPPQEGSGQLGAITQPPQWPFALRSCPPPRLPLPPPSQASHSLGLRQPVQRLKHTSCALPRGLCPECTAPRHSPPERPFLTAVLLCATALPRFPWYAHSHPR